jgi:hypothetical protein
MVFVELEVLATTLGNYGVDINWHDSDNPDGASDRISTVSRFPRIFLADDGRLAGI